MYIRSHKSQDKNKAMKSKEISVDLRDKIVARQNQDKGIKPILKIYVFPGAQWPW